MTSTKEELQRLVNLLPETDPRTDEYHMLLRSIEYLGNDSVSDVIDNILAEGETKPFELKELKKEADPTPDPEPQEGAEDKEPKVGFEYLPKLTPEQVKDLLGTETPDKEQVRGFLADAKLADNIVSKPFLEEIGAKNLSSVPAELYPQLLFFVEHARGNV